MNNSKSKSINSSERLNLDSLLSQYQINNKKYFSFYLKDLYEDLSERSNSSNKGINKLTFLKVLYLI